MSFASAAPCRFSTASSGSTLGSPTGRGLGSQPIHAQEPCSRHATAAGACVVDLEADDAPRGCRRTAIDGLKPSAATAKRRKTYELRASKLVPVTLGAGVNTNETIIMDKTPTQKTKKALTAQEKRELARKKFLKERKALQMKLQKSMLQDTVLVRKISQYLNGDLWKHALPIDDQSDQMAQQ